MSEGKDEVNRDQEIMAQMDAIKKEVAESAPLMSDVMDTSTLLAEYGDPLFTTKIKSMLDAFPKMRKTRGDGNCFYRAYAYGIAEHFAAHKDKLPGFLETLKQTFDMALAAGYPEFTAEDFYETVQEQFARLKDEPMEALHATFNDDGLSNYIVAYFRLVTAAHMKTHVDDFLPFLEGGETVAAFCARAVDPFGVDCEHLQIIALTQALGVAVNIAYLDRSAGETAAQHVIPDGQEPLVFLLYRPGHYDILYPPPAVAHT
ncbi:hypothetical protein PTSG_05213 [Salpingoeca rosetta]|uniref:ubiquitinyl hydrolase 1 n=1 Tax=Salpingoeca rosetta (strain ATCC 50818 / BSB-021) TaxID=946362 RepID=F2UAU3_SALR5|nr:uncharacterized protein PTSG_05213 [Salpingoeca rosetta]EGD73509.1 hypothetical protein PTSG_05213 [Salpingoeca rosetta]|eukprot:XP_004993791.1 hypothetical protein PTSG_05213 [Salpingoeca rosetta]